MRLKRALPRGVFLASLLLQVMEEPPLTPPRRVKKNPLTRRQRELLRLVEEELTDEEIAARIFRSVGTVRKHLQKAYKTLGMHDRYTAADTARERGHLD